ncbi:MAG: carbohydrate porin [Burkholderiaceae bacterium]
MGQVIGAWAWLVLSSAAYGDGASPNQGLLGEGGGLRTTLYEEGIDFQLGFTTEAAYNTQGGDRHLLSNADQFNLGSTLDLGRIWGWADSKIQIAVTYRSGGNLSEDARLGTLQQVQEIYGRGQTWRWTQLWYDGVFFNRVLDVKVGRVGVGEDFFSFPCAFENLTFCGSLPGNILSDWYNWPVSQWGARAKVNIRPEWYVQMGVYQINPNYLTRDEAFRLNDPPGTIGALIPIEAGWTPTLGPLGLPASYRVGAWYDTSAQPDVYTAADHLPLVESPGTGPLERRGTKGGYLMFMQQLRGPADGGSGALSLFFNFVQADKHTTRIDQLISLGLLYKGPLAARPQDDLGIAVGRTHVNSRVADGESLENAIDDLALPVQGSEYPIELYYTFNATPWLALRPNIQYIAQPGGTTQNRDVVVLGLKASVKF